MMTLQHKEAVEIHNAARTNAIITGGVVCFLSLLVAFLFGIVGGVKGWWFTDLLVWGIIGVGVTASLVLIVTGELVGRGHVSKVVKVYAEHYNDGYNVKWLPELPAPTQPAQPALPAENDTFDYNHHSRGGQKVPRNLLHGFDPRDLEYLCRYLGNGGKFTEASMEAIPLPFMLEKMGKASEGTPYTRFITVCVDAGIIVGREGKRSGMLAVSDPLEMMQKIKALNA